MDNDLTKRELGGHMERLKFFYTSQGISQSSFISMCKLGERFFSKTGTLLIPEEWCDIILTFPQLNIYWVLFEEGKMLVDRNVPPKKTNKTLEWRWRHFLEDLDMSMLAFEKEVGLSHSSMRRMMNKIPIEKLYAIHTSYPTLSIEYILCGLGSLYSERPKELNRSTIVPDISSDVVPTAPPKNKSYMQSPVLYEVPVLPISAFGGGLCGEGAQVLMRDCEKFRLPFKADVGVTIVGTSMVDTSGDRLFMTDYHPGDTIFIEKLGPDEPIQWGHVYVLDTNDGIIVKILRKSEKENTVMCESINKAFQPFEVPTSIINNFYKIVGMMRLIKR